eukprot:m.886584 g.886584  ORF g.886584 m.886584 type:complete len:231 (+) comp23626_c1_seq5:32-724(+)
MMAAVLPSATDGTGVSMNGVGVEHHPVPDDVGVAMHVGGVDGVEVPENPNVAAVPVPAMTAQPEGPPPAPAPPKRGGARKGAGRPKGSLGRKKRGIPLGPPEPKKKRGRPMTYMDDMQFKNVQEATQFIKVRCGTRVTKQRCSEVLRFMAFRIVGTQDSPGTKSKKIAIGETEKATGCGHDMARHAYDTLLLGGEKDIADFITMHTMHAPKMPPTRSSAPKKQAVPQLQV